MDLYKPADSRFKMGYWGPCGFVSQPHEEVDVYFLVPLPGKYRGYALGSDPIEPPLCSVLTHGLMVSSTQRADRRAGIFMDWEKIIIIFLSDLQGYIKYSQAWCFQRHLCSEGQRKERECQQMPQEEKLI